MQDEPIVEAEILDDEPLTDDELEEIRRTEELFAQAKARREDQRPGLRKAMILSIRDLCIAYGMPGQDAMAYAKRQTKAVVAALQRGRQL